MSSTTAGERIGIIGGGFAGIMTAVQLIERSTDPLEIILIHRPGSAPRGTAYSPYSKAHLLNVPAARMSAYPDRPDHFLEWVMRQPDFAHAERSMVAGACLPRQVYGRYLEGVWSDALTMAAHKGIGVRTLEDEAVDLEVASTEVRIVLRSGEMVRVLSCVLALGNHVPRDPVIANTAFCQGRYYFRNPWKPEAVTGLTGPLPVLIIGNGLTMVDTVLGLLDNGYQGTIHSISPNGYNILPHRHIGVVYTKLSAELRDDMSLHELVVLVNRHIRSVRELGISSEPVIDALRPHVQGIWQRLSASERRTFMTRFRHRWGVARHRIPLHVHDRMQQLRLDGRLHVTAGRILDITETHGTVTVEYFDRRHGDVRRIQAARVINCTGPETDVMKLDGTLLKNAVHRGIIQQDELKLGIRVDTATLAVRNGDGAPHERLFALGSILRGELWETTGVTELRVQAQLLATGVLGSASFQRHRIAAPSWL